SRPRACAGGSRCARAGGAFLGARWPACLARWRRASCGRIAHEPSMLLTEEQRLVRDTMRSFAQAELAPNAARWDREHYFPREALRALGALGALGMVVP